MSISKFEPTIFLTAFQRGLQTYSTAKSETRDHTRRIKGEFHAVTYDSVHDQVYWSGVSGVYKIWRANRNGENVEVVLSTREYGAFYGLDYDWIANNIYACTPGGNILVCDMNADREFPCTKLLTDQGRLAGIAWNPIEGFMYYTKDVWSSNGSIYRAGMDGSNPSSIVTGLNRPEGITIDFRSSRLYWTCRGDNSVQSSTFEGRNTQTVVQRPRGSQTWGIAVSGGRIFWTNFETRTLESSYLMGQDLRVLHSSSHMLWGLAVVPRLNLPQGRTNDCAGQTCSKVCVLSPTSFRCLS